MALSINKTNPYTSPNIYHTQQVGFYPLITPYTISGKIVDIENKRIFSGTIYINGMGIIEKIEEHDVPETHFILPPFVDSHIHIESTMAVPSEFAKVAVKHGVAAAVCDPHEIANVLGEKGIRYMIDNGKTTPFKFFFGAPSCVPAAPYETSGATLDSTSIEELMSDNDIYFLGEVMNFPAVIQNDKDMLSKIQTAKKHGKRVDGHAPGLCGKDLTTYAASGITTDHECMTITEAEEKISLGMKVLIREGSAAKNFEALYTLIDKYPDRVMFCTDDIHPDDLQKGYINFIVKKAFEKGLNKFNALQAATFNPVLHYNLSVGLLRKGDFADFVVVDNLEDLNILQTYIQGRSVYDNGKVGFKTAPVIPVNNFKAETIAINDLKVCATTDKMQVIEIVDKELYTKKKIVSPKVLENEVVADVANDILKIVVINRYSPHAKPAIGFVHNVGIKKGAICSTVAHDSHNIIAVGVNDESIMVVVNEIIRNKGGIAAFDGEELLILPLPVAGIMSDKSLDEIANEYQKLDSMAKNMGSMLTAPFMTLAFMALIVIPELKICDKGLFDVVNFKPTNLFI